jgi:CheY-like chemotaxis protein
MNTAASGVLVIDDDEAIREAVEELLVDEGYSVRAAGNGSEALALLRSSPRLPCVILLDLMMPVMDGFAFRRTQAQDPRLADIPVVVISADSTVTRKASELSVQAALAKPLRLETLLSTVARYCTCGEAEKSG